MNYISTLASIMTIILFLFYFVGRIITIISVKRLWYDKIIIGKLKDNKYGIVDSIINNASLSTEEPYGYIISKSGMRNIRIYNVDKDENLTYLKKGELIYQRSFLNIDEAIAIHVVTGELHPELFIEYESIDYMKVIIEWVDNLKSGVQSELVKPSHTWKSVLYNLLK